MEPEGWGFKSSTTWDSTFKWAVTDISRALQSFKSLATPNPKTVSHASSRVKSSAELAREPQALHSIDTTVISQLFWAKHFCTRVKPDMPLNVPSTNHRKSYLSSGSSVHESITALCAKEQDGEWAPEPVWARQSGKKIPPPTGIWTPFTPPIATLLRDK